MQTSQTEKSHKPNTPTIPNPIVGSVTKAKGIKDQHSHTWNNLQAFLLKGLFHLQEILQIDTSTLGESINGLFIRGLSKLLYTKGIQDLVEIKFAKYCFTQCFKNTRISPRSVEFLHPIAKEIYFQNKVNQPSIKERFDKEKYKMENILFPIIKSQHTGELDIKKIINEIESKDLLLISAYDLVKILI